MGQEEQTKKPAVAKASKGEESSQEMADVELVDDDLAHVAGGKKKFKP